MIVLKDVTLRYGSQKVLDRVSLSIKKGEVKAIVGSSGSGKSTIIKLMLGLIKPTSGHVFVDGIDITLLKESELYPIRRKMGIVFQGNALFDSMTVVENMSFFLRENLRLDDTEIRRRVYEQIKFAELTGFENTLPESLSGGMRKRVAIGRALIFNPTLVFFDEPTAGLDPISSERILNLVLKMKKEIGLGAVLVTHILSDVKHIADSIAVLHEQEIIFDDEVALFWKSRHPFIESFLKNNTI